MKQEKNYELEQEMNLNVQYCIVLLLVNVPVYFTSDLLAIVNTCQQNFRLQC
jgi:hypothetical protein